MQKKNHLSSYACKMISKRVCEQKAKPFFQNDSLDYIKLACFSHNKRIPSHTAIFTFRNLFYSHFLLAAKVPKLLTIALE
jgi:hypothetical protein